MRVNFLWALALVDVWKQEEMNAKNVFNKSSKEPSLPLRSTILLCFTQFFTSKSFSVLFSFQMYISEDYNINHTEQHQQRDKNINAFEITRYYDYDLLSTNCGNADDDFQMKGLMASFVARSWVYWTVMKWKQFFTKSDFYKHESKFYDKKFDRKSIWIKNLLWNRNQRQRVFIKSMIFINHSFFKELFISPPR